jgi:hypothetical protein
VHGVTKIALPTPAPLRGTSKAFVPLLWEPFMNGDHHVFSLRCVFEATCECTDPVKLVASATLEAYIERKLSMRSLTCQS